MISGSKKCLEVSIITPLKRKRGVSVIVTSVIANYSFGITDTQYIILR